MIIAIIVGVAFAVYCVWFAYRYNQQHVRWMRLLDAWKRQRPERVECLRSYAPSNPQQATAIFEQLELMNVGDIDAARLETGMWTTRQAELAITGVPPQPDPAPCMVLPLSVLRRVALAGLDATPWTWPLDKSDAFQFMIGLGQTLRVTIGHPEKNETETIDVFGSVAYRFRFEGTIVRLRRSTTARYIRGRKPWMLRGHIPGTQTPPIEWVHMQLSYIDQVIQPILTEELDRYVGRATGAAGSSYMPVQ